jgi:HTH domain
MPRFAHEDGGDEVWVDSTPYPKNTARRSSRKVDPKRVDAGFMLAFIYLLDNNDYTPGELGKIFKISRATVYRLINELRETRELKLNAYLETLDDEDYWAYLEEHPEVE